ncbi:hypothetical protein PR202_gb20802 [Eleusine coracana subsp. coracana]|uniref:KIB1-4 beta-propeller domain-containing protein n=1 Tax=Eleusine coracana subsp. coracana TaxID=191504 RepID=A0AAV5F9F4_ELECO|nr:hypothetical protein PR202_gb20802 [Eleusine coracana subsp. coracana]
MAFYQGKLYAIARDENLRIVNITEEPSTGDPQVFQIEHIIPGDPSAAGLDSLVKKKIYLVESCGTLLMVCRKICCKKTDMGLVAGRSEFEVFKADLKQSQWVQVSTLGDGQMLFLARPCTRAIATSQYGIPGFGMLGDQIFFLDDEVENAFEEYTFEPEATFVIAYDMRTSEVSSPLPMV